MNERHLRSAQPSDAFVCVLLLNSTQEPHFSTTTRKFVSALTDDDSRYSVTEQNGCVTGLSSFWSPEFHPSHAWIGLHLHPDHRNDDTVSDLLHHQAERARAAGHSHLWVSFREDYASAWPDLATLGFQEVHRTFGGGFHLNSWQADTTQLETRLHQEGYEIHLAASLQHDTRIQNLYQLVRDEKVSAPPTIPPANEVMVDEDTLWDSAFTVLWHDEIVGIALPEKARLGAWNAVLVVHPEHRRNGLATALLANVARSLQTHGLSFLNVAGVVRDTAYLGMLQRLGAKIEPDWVAWELKI